MRKTLRSKTQYYSYVLPSYADMQMFCLFAKDECNLFVYICSIIVVYILKFILDYMERKFEL